MGTGKLSAVLSLFVIFICGCSANKNITQSSALYGPGSDTVKAQRFDMGKMWTFDNPPAQYFKDEYNFDADSNWFASARKGALKFGNGCSASFVSEDGLIMTNHHCVRNLLNGIALEGENILKDGFKAASTQDERRIPGMFVLQLITIEDVTDEIHSEMAKGISDSEKVYLLELKEEEITARQENDSLRYVVVSLYNGGKYSLYGYRRYDDIRLVFVPDLRTAKLGGDYDNFTYPRHGLDCAFLRAYEDDKPVKSLNFFRWNENGAEEGEPIFVVGNPGSTARISTMAQLEFDRDVTYPSYVSFLERIYDDWHAEVMKTNADDYDLIAKLYSIGNTLKVMKGTLESLKDPLIMGRKQDFENKFRKAVTNDPVLNKKYGHLWDEIRKSGIEAKQYAYEASAYAVSPSFSSAYITAARKIAEAAEKGTLTSLSADDLYPDNFNAPLQEKVLAAQIDLYNEKLGNSNVILNNFLGGRRGEEAVRYIISNSKIVTRQGAAEILKLTPEQVLESNDPLLRFAIESRTRQKELQVVTNALTSKAEINNQMLGEALFKIYGETIPPDATGTLRISDGVIKSYDYNGTIAPTQTTFYGTLEKYFAFNKKFPFNLPPVWENLPEDFDLSAPLNFIATNDIIGGNSGSPVINRNLEIIGLAFDGNYESLSARYIYTTEMNRTICVHPKGMIEAIRHLYRFTRLSDELTSGRISK